LSLVKPLPRDDLEEYLAISRYESFQDLQGRVSIIYKKLLGRSPFSKFDGKKTILLHKQFQAARIDVLLLFQIRHQLIDCNGQVNRKYYEKLNEYYCRERLDANLMKPYSERNFFPDPDKILSSPAINKTFTTKLEECADALRLYGHYITAICT
jgi:hypothetical protein